MLIVKALAPLEHLGGESIALSVHTVPAFRILQHTRNDRSQLELDLGKRAATLALIANVLAHCFSQEGERYQGSVGGSAKSAIQLFRKWMGLSILWR
jgi:hypothetical protein